MLGKKGAHLHICSVTKEEHYLGECFPTRKKQELCWIRKVLENIGVGELSI